MTLPPLGAYNHITNNICLTNIASLTGTTVGCLIPVWVNGNLPTALACKTGSIGETETRLWAALVSLMLYLAECNIYGVGVANHVH